LMSIVGFQAVGSACSLVLVAVSAGCNHFVKEE
jgi:hypothetical protein